MMESRSSGFPDEPVLGDDFTEAEESDPLISLLMQWEERYRVGSGPSVESLCVSRPELIEPLRERIRRQRRLYDLLEPEAVPEHKTIDVLPSRFGRYEIIKKLAEGGTAAVYLAHDIGLDRLVALKVPHPEFERSPEMVDRFQREARAAAAFRHPNFCPVFDVGRIDGHHFIAMAYINGRPLSASIDPRCPVDQESAARWVRQLALALEEAHRRGIIHRDLKPSNVMVDLRGELIILDFGLALRLESNHADLTKTGAVLGTPYYMAPEQVEGNKALIGPATDVYALGVILYELLTGLRPFPGTATRAMGLILVQDPPPPRSHRQDVDPDLEVICMKAMARSIADRYPTMREFARALGAWQEERRPASRPPAKGSPKPSEVNTESSPAGFDEFSPFYLETSVPATSRLGRLINAWRWAHTVALCAMVLLVGGIGIGIDKSRSFPAEPPPPATQPSSSATNGISSATRTGMAVPASGDARVVTNSIGMKLVPIESGSFMMGTNDGEEDERPPHLVRITRPFYLGKYEVTQEEYERVTQSNPSWFSESGEGKIGAAGQDTRRMPVEQVSWLEAVKFCNALSEKENLNVFYDVNGSNVTVPDRNGSGYRLPTEAEWEYSCRAEKDDKYLFEDGAAHLGEFAWYVRSSGGRVHRVGEKAANAWGLHDMHGNVWEWCFDGFADDSYRESPPTDPDGDTWAWGRVMRGGYFDSNILCVRTTDRCSNPQDFRALFIGFRVARNQPGR